MAKRDDKILDGDALENGFRHTITNASEHRRLLLDAMIGLVEGKLNVSQANALTGLSTEVHKSIRLEFDILTYAAGNFRIGPGNKVELIGDGQDS